VCLNQSSAVPAARSCPFISCSTLGRFGGNYWLCIGNYEGACGSGSGSALRAANCSLVISGMWYVYVVCGVVVVVCGSISYAAVSIGPKSARSRGPRRCAGRRAGARRRDEEPRPRRPESCPGPLAVNAPRLRLRLGGTISTELGR
jgi:hypothetical protein